jgi:hypothetical protein
MESKVEHSSFKTPFHLFRLTDFGGVGPCPTNNLLSKDLS